jgi:nucleotide-binding universal stress UspA family protein
MGDRLLITPNGSAVAEIIRSVAARRADLVASTTPGRSGVPRVMVGSVAEAVLRMARDPVLMFRSPDAPPLSTTAGRPS